MHIILFLICTVLAITAGRACLRATAIRPELILISLVSLYLAYPVKNLALAYLKDDFITFDFYAPASPIIYVHFIIFTFIIWIVLLRVIARTPTPLKATAGATKMIRAPGAAFDAITKLLLVTNALLMLWSVYQATEGQILGMLFTSDARKAFLLNQQGQGWISLLIFFAFPLIGLQDSRAFRNPLVLGGIAITFLALAAIGSRLYLFGYVICLIIRFYRMTPLIAGIMFLGFVLFGALIYMGFAGERSVNSTYYGLIYFMRTFDGADLMNGYLESGRQIYYGVTLVQEIFLTYVPRILWASKPFNFGGIAITGDIYPDLQDVQTLRATFPPGLFLEAYANFWLFCPVFYYATVRLFVILSHRRYHRNVYVYALYIAASAVAATMFRGFGSFAVALTAFSMVLLLIFFLVLPFRSRALRTSAAEKFE